MSLDPKTANPSEKQSRTASDDSNGAADSKGAAAEGAPVGQTPANQQQQVTVNDKGAICSYANFCRATGTPEELILDFGLNSQPFGMTSEAVTITQRIVLNYFTSKRLLHALSLSVQRHEQAFGVLETDVNKRVTPAARAAARP